MNIKSLIREGLHDNEVRTALLHAIGHRAKDGWEAEKLRNEKNPVHESMATIGG